MHTDGMSLLFSMEIYYTQCQTFDYGLYGKQSFTAKLVTQT